MKCLHRRQTEILLGLTKWRTKRHGSFVVRVCQIIPTRVFAVHLVQPCVYLRCDARQVVTGDFVHVRVEFQYARAIASEILPLVLMNVSCADDNEQSRPLVGREWNEQSIVGQYVPTLNALYVGPVVNR